MGQHVCPHCGLNGARVRVLQADWRDMRDQRDELLIENRSLRERLQVKLCQDEAERLKTPPEEP